MRILELTLQTTKLNEQRAFYTQTLGLPLFDARENSFTVQAGETQLTFETTQQVDGIYHFAFLIPRNKLQQSRNWLQDRKVSLVADENGQVEIATPNWNANSVYFYDPAGNSAEFIAHDDLNIEREGEFSSHDILHISEIALVVDDVPAQVAQLKERLGLEIYKEALEVFAPVGDISGLLIVVKTGRPWRLSNIGAVALPTHITLTGEQEQSYQIAALPYTIDVVTSSHLPT